MPTSNVAGGYRVIWYTNDRLIHYWELARCEQNWRELTADAVGKRLAATRETLKPIEIEIHCMTTDDGAWID